MQTSVIYQGDNLKILPDIPDESVDLIYIDPPFNSSRQYETFWNEDAELRAFDDRFGNVDSYIEWLRPRAAELRRVLKRAGCVFVHCDSHANYRIRMLFQEELGLHFRSEIIWKRSFAHSDGKQGRKAPGRIHDTILFLSKGKQYTWNPMYTEYDPDYVASEYRHTTASGRQFKESDVTAAKPGGETEFDWWVKRETNKTGARWIADLEDEHLHPKAGLEYKAVRPYRGRYWAYSIENLRKFARDGKLRHRKTGMPRLMQFAVEMPGVPLQDLWTDIKPAPKRERVGYPTQKPAALMARLIQLASNDKDVVLDAFCGCGTTLVAAAALGRRWIGIDMSPTACNVVADRLFRDCKLVEGQHFVTRTRKSDLVTLKEMDPWDFQNWAIIALGGIPNQRKGKDLGIDGHLYISNPSAPKKVQRTLAFGMITGKQTTMFEKSIPVQVKQKGKAGRIDVDNFQTALRRKKRTMGVLIAFDFTKDARDEVDRAQRADGIIIHLFTAEQLLEMQAA